MEKVKELYNELLEMADEQYATTHGLQILHQGSNIDENSVLFVGRENRGHGRSISQIRRPIDNFIVEDLDWLDDSYKYSRSPFWRVIGKSLHRTTGAPYNARIYEKLYWTNIYKLSPVQAKGNTAKVRKLQLDINAQLLLEEIRTIQPKAVVFFTDHWVLGFLSKWQAQGAISKLVNTAADYFNLEFHFITAEGPVPALVLPHPQNKKGSFREQDLEDRTVSFLSGLKQA